jgi:hypothetical protein
MDMSHKCKRPKEILVSRYVMTILKGSYDYKIRYVFV